MPRRVPFRLDNRLGILVEMVPPFPFLKLPLSLHLSLTSYIVILFCFPSEFHCQCPWEALNPILFGPPAIASQKGEKLFNSHFFEGGWRLGHRRLNFRYNCWPNVIALLDRLPDCLRQINRLANAYSSSAVSR